MEREALKLAFAALEEHDYGVAQIIIREALAQSAQEPEYWNVIDPAGNIVASETDAIRGWARIAGSYKPTVEGLLGFHEQGWRVVPAPPLPVQKPVAWTLLLTSEHHGIIGEAGEKFIGAPECYQRVDVYTAPPQRPWVGLTAEDILALFDEHNLYGSKLVEFARAVETKIKEKNND
jgi:hypothetical protein